MIHWSRALSTLLSLTLATSWSPAVVRAADAAPSPSPSATQSERTVAVVGLESEQTERAQALTDALRRAFSVRGFTGGEAVSLVELRLTMGCEDDTPACLAEAGKDLAVKQLLYGYLRPASNGQMLLELKLVDVDAGGVQAQTSVQLPPTALTPAEIDATASRIVAELLGEEAEPATPPRPAIEPADAPPPTAADDTAQRSSSRYEWGTHRPIAGWKRAGFGVSLTLTLLAAGTAGGLTWAISSDGPIRADLLEEARKSLEDDKPSNDIDPNQPAGVDLCKQALAEPPGEPNKVVNGPVSRVCRRAEYSTIAANVMWGVTAAAAISTVVFTTLMFVRKRSASTTARRFTFDGGFGPTGVVLRGGIKF